MSKDNFADLFDLVFVTRGSDGSEIDLSNFDPADVACGGVAMSGHSMPVTWADRAEYISRVEAFRLSEGFEQVGAIREGLSSIIPWVILRLLTWRELRYLVCGK